MADESFDDFEQHHNDALLTEDDLPQTPTNFAEQPSQQGTQPTIVAATTQAQSSEQSSTSGNDERLHQLHDEMRQRVMQQYYTRVKEYHKQLAALLGEKEDTIFIDEEEGLALDRLRKKYPNSRSFEHDGDTSHSLAERLVEFEAEALLKKKKEYVAERRQLYTKFGASQQAFVSQIADSIDDISSLRNNRQQVIEKHATIPPFQLPTSQAILYEQEVNLALEKRNTMRFMHQTMKLFYTERRDTLRLKKYKLLHRWARFGDQMQVLDRTDAILSTRLKKIEKESDFVSSKLLDLHKCNVETMEKNILSPKDYSVYIRHLSHDMAVSKKLDKFFCKLKVRACLKFYLFVVVTLLGTF